MNQDIQSLFKNAITGKCIICGNQTEPTAYKCLKCHKQCLPVYDNSIKDKHEMSFVILDIKSNCCDYDVKIMSRITCSEKCHNEFIELMEKTCGKNKKITDATTGISHRVPTKDIIENGINQKDLSNYPIWSDDKPRRIPVQ